MLRGWLQLARVVPFWQGALAKKGGDDITFVRSESFAICVTFFSERLEPNISRALGRAVLKNMEENSRFFCLGRK